MQRDSSPLRLPNTFRDSNEIPTKTASSIEKMDLNSEPRHSIIGPAESDNSRSPRMNSPNRNRMTNRPLVKSIIQSNESNDERPSQEQPEPTFNRNLINENNSLLEASGFDSARLAEVDADAAYALQLQQEEYSRESLMPNRHPYLPFRVESDDESGEANPPIFFEPDAPQLTNDEQLAAYLQQREERTRQLYRQPPWLPFPVRQRSDPGSTQTSEADEPENIAIPPNRFPQRQSLYNEDDDDEENPHWNGAQALLQFLANQGQPLPESFHPFFSGLRRGYRRTGNIQDTEEDFGPEDYEQLLQLDDSINKKKLTKDQINLIPQIKFHRTSNNSDEENKCGVCLELFEENQVLRQFPCHHVYHKECGDRWLQENNVCPICREPPIKIQSTSNPRHHRGMPNSRRPSNNNRNPSTRNNNNNNTHSHNNRRGPPPHRQS